MNSNQNELQTPLAAGDRADFSIESGKVIIYRVYDVAEEIDLARVEAILSEPQQGLRVRLDRTRRPSVLVRNEPIRLRVGEVNLRIGDRDYQAAVSATVLDYGVLSIALHLGIPSGTKMQSLLELAEAINRSGGDEAEIDAVARKKAEDITSQLSKAFKRPQLWEVSEDYVIYFLQKVNGVKLAADLLRAPELAALLQGESRETLAGPTRDGILENRFQYAENDLAVIDWNSAVVYEPSGQMEIADVIEFALTHLLEVRYYDDLLDHRLGEMYDEVEVRRSGVFQRRINQIVHEANSRYLEISEIMERVDNSIKVVGDFYLAVIFRGAIRRFRVLDWQQSITRKMNSIARVSELLQGEMNVRRSHMLEMIVIALIAFEVVGAFFR